MKIKAALLPKILLIAVVGVLGQTNEENPPVDTWFAKFGFNEPHILKYRFDTYSEDDLQKFKEKSDILLNVQNNSLWEGRYAEGGEALVSFSQLHWNSDKGFVSFYIETCFPELRSIRYGSVIETPDYILLTPDNKQSKNAIPLKYVKVKWNDWQFLVSEDALAAFGKRAVGLQVSTDSSYTWTKYWVRSSDTDTPLSGQPSFPNAYKKYERSPIVAKMVSIGKRTFGEEMATGNGYHSADNAYYPITINAGTLAGVKKGMQFKVADTGEEMTITRVFRNTAIGIIVRPLDEEKKDFCWDDDSQKIPCPELKKAFSVKTYLGRFYL